MEFFSILSETADNQIPQEACEMPAFFTDLNLDRIVGEVLQGKEEYRLESFFYQGLKEIPAINYRLDVMKDIECPDVYKAIAAFTGKMNRIREYLDFSRTVHNRYQQKKWVLDAAGLYCDSVSGLHGSLSSLNLKSKGLNLFLSWLNDYVESEIYKVLASDTGILLEKFGHIRYSLEIEGDKVIINTDDCDGNYCSLISESLKQLNEESFDFRISFFTDIEMSSLENKILDIVREMNLPVFLELDGYCMRHADFIDSTVTSFDREVQFYISYCDYIRKLKARGFSFAYPVLWENKILDVDKGYDLALAYKLSGPAAEVIPNDFALRGDERIFVLTGPNQGGKTTFARALGQIFFLASLGLPVPCKKAGLFLCSNVLTHFSTEENLDTKAGRLKEELVRLKHLMENVKSNSVVIINELFSTTTSQDAYAMGKRLLDFFIAADCVCLYVTHISELSRLSEKTISLVADIDADGGAKRTYRIDRRPADGRAYANSIAAGYRLSCSDIKERIRI